MSFFLQTLHRFLPDTEHMWWKHCLPGSAVYIQTPKVLPSQDVNRIFTTSAGFAGDCSPASQCPFPGCSSVCRVVCACRNPPPALWTELEVVLLAPVHKVLNKFSVGSVAPDEADDSRAIREL